MDPKLASIVCLGLFVAIGCVSVIDCAKLTTRDEQEDDPPIDAALLPTALDDDLVHQLRPQCRQLELNKTVVLDVDQIESLYDKIMDILRPQPGLAAIYRGSFDLFNKELAGFKSNPQLRAQAIKKHSKRVCDSLNDLFKIVNDVELTPSSVPRTYDIPQLKEALASKTMVKLADECQRRSPYQVTQATLRAAYPELVEMVAHDLHLFVQDSAYLFKSQMKQVAGGDAQVDRSKIIADHSERVCEVLKRLVETSESLDKANVEEISSPNESF